MNYHNAHMEHHFTSEMSSSDGLMSQSPPTPLQATVIHLIPRARPTAALSPSPCRDCSSHTSIEGLGGNYAETGYNQELFRFDLNLDLKPGTSDRSEDAEHFLPSVRPYCVYRVPVACT
ncbi:hypothetical protein RRG08_051027 [Elysia crispata]|uniref:Uncharacterized protein n=1 Tax=Elysia crispata TaxID=231223 RepID=A0AAE0Z4T3_9GAST|nr:hypothetical protein RRG08_051027 [Elysia crispata]